MVVGFRFLLGLLGLLVSSCIAFTSFDGYDTRPPMPVLFGVAGTVDGIPAGEVTLSLNGGATLSAGNGSFAFPKSLVNGASWLVEIRTAPPNSSCAIAAPSGVIASADVTDVAVHCISIDAALGALSFSAGSLSPSFVPALTSYAVGPVHTGFLASHATTVTATTVNPNASVTINGAPAASGVASAPFAIGPGPKPFDIAVTAPDGKTTAHYAVVVTGYLVDYAKASNTRPGALFGTAVALDGDTLAIGSPGESSASSNGMSNPSDTSQPTAGAVYVFVRSKGVWTQQAFLKAWESHAGDRFGAAVALSGDTLAVAVPEEASASKGVNGDPSDTTATASGAVYVFTRTGTSWSQQAYLKASNTTAEYRFGSAVALSGDTLAVGSTGECSAAVGVGGDDTNTNAKSAGAVYVFERQASMWAQRTYVKASNTRPSASFGVSLALGSTTLVVGAEGDTSGSSGVNGKQSDAGLDASGAAYVFVRNGQGFAQQAFLKATNPRVKALFGHAVAISGDTIAVGSPSESSASTGVGGDPDDQSSFGAGAVYTYTRSGTTWSVEAYVKASNTRADAELGSAVALAGNLLAVGSWRESGAAKGLDGPQMSFDTPESGAVYLFERTSVWAQAHYLKATNTHETAYFGWSVALDASTLVAGAPYENGNATGLNGNQSDLSASSAGAAYVF